MHDRDRRDRQSPERHGRRSVHRRPPYVVNADAGCRVGRQQRGRAGRARVVVGRPVRRRHAGEGDQALPLPLQPLRSIAVAYRSKPNLPGLVSVPNHWPECATEHRPRRETGKAKQETCRLQSPPNFHGMCPTPPATQTKPPAPPGPRPASHLLLAGRAFHLRRHSRRDQGEAKISPGRLQSPPNFHGICPTPPATQFKPPAPPGPRPASHLLLAGRALPLTRCLGGAIVAR